MKTYITLSLRVTLAVLSIMIVSAGKAYCGAFQLTIYVDEGHGELNGHVFFGLTGGDSTVFAGWYSHDKTLAPLAKGGGEIRDDSSLVYSCDWDIKKRYEITSEGYLQALVIMNKWNTDGLPWALRHNCADFSEAVAVAAGIKVGLPFGPEKLGGNRPGIFGDYLRRNGGDAGESTFRLNGPITTGIDIQSNETVSFTASGEVSFGENVGSAGPEGKTKFLWGPLLIDIDTSLNLVRSLNHGSVIARVGGSSTWRYVGPENLVTFGQSGTLELSVNDRFPDDNKGVFEVKVKLCRP
jgi:hypothetical protein